MAILREEKRWVVLTAHHARAALVHFAETSIAYRAHRTPEGTVEWFGADAEVVGAFLDEYKRKYGLNQSVSI